MPLGTYFLFFLNQDAKGGFTRLATMQDQYTHGRRPRLHLPARRGPAVRGQAAHDQAQPAEETSGPRARRNWLVTDRTRVWKGDRQVKLADLAVGDELLFNLTGKTATSPGTCTDVWVGVETHRLATEGQQRKYDAFVKFRGLPGWIDRVEGNTLTVTLFSGDPKEFGKRWMDGFAVGKDLMAAVANDELRTWNPPTDKEKAALVEVQKAPTDGYGSTGVRLVFTVANLLEGFRKGRVVRVFAAGWPVKDQFYGESLMGYGYSRLPSAELEENPAKEYPSHFPFRTDFGNDHLPWYGSGPTRPRRPFPSTWCSGSWSRRTPPRGRAGSAPTGRARRWTSR